MIALRPRNNWSVDGNTLIWQDDIGLKPTPEEIEQKKQELIAELPIMMPAGPKWYENVL